MVGLLILIAGLVLWFATGLATLGIILTILGGVLLLIQVVFVVAVLVTAAKLGKKARVRLW